MGKFTIDFGKFLGSGKYGNVYNAFQERQYKTGKRFACKVIEVQDEETIAKKGQLEEIKSTKGTPLTLGNGNKFLGLEQGQELRRKETEQDKKVKNLKKLFSQEVNTLQLIDSKHVIRIIKAY